ncbi:MAG: Hsp20/alpha crystallin family protein [Deltaproteobacteria bacterium]|nr:Hsp20/alpha crystallin family protein [Deltaproteobacteria bacterium]
MAKKNAHKKENQKPDAEIELGGKGLLGGFFKGLGSLIELADKLGKTGGIEKSGTFGVNGQKDVNGVYGFSIKTMTGPGGAARPVVQPFGDLSKFKPSAQSVKKQKPAGPTVEEAREPLTDIFDEGGFVRIVVELPGVSEPELVCEIQGDDIVQISTTGNKKYSKEILLTHKIDPASEEKRFTNGVLELKLKKKVK